MIDPALSFLLAYDQFIICRFVPMPNGRTNKLPLDWRTYQVANALDPQNWTNYETAERAALMAGAGHGVAFALSDNDPFSCLDADGCVTNGVLSPLAHEITAALPGAVREISQSGQGNHWWMITAKPPIHGCKNIALGLELYHTKRFIALGQPGAVGMIGPDSGPALDRVIAKYFTSMPVQSQTPVQWTDGPLPGCGIPDDTELLRRAMQNEFGGKTRFQSLWEADEDALGELYPAQDERPYDSSSVDAALAAQLLFWTGGDCERTQRLMFDSALVRDKWLQRPNYLRDTISKIRASKTEENVYSAPRKKELPAQGAEQMRGEMCDPPLQAQLFKGCVYVREVDQILIPDGSLLTRNQFDTTYGGNAFMMGQLNEKTTRSAWEAFTQSFTVDFPKVAMREFRPSAPFGEIREIDGIKYVNTYRPAHVVRQRGDLKPYRHQMGLMLPDERDRAVLESYLAFCVQYLGMRANWCPVIQGVEGNGKSFINECMQYAIGARHSYTVRAKHLTGKFNAWMYGKLLIFVEDIRMHRNDSEALETLKPMITAPRLEMEGKGANQVVREMTANFILNSNHQDAVTKTQNDRRFAPLFCAQQHVEDLERDGMTGEYFRNLFRWAENGGYAAIADYLYNYPIPDELNPAKLCIRAPLTSSTQAAVTANLGPLEQEIIERIEQEQVGFRGGWVSSHYIDLLVRDLRLDNEYPRRARRVVMETLGYRPHPALEQGRATRVLSPDNTRPTLYIKRGDPLAEMGAEMTMARYTKDQMDTQAKKIPA